MNYVCRLYSRKASIEYLSYAEYPLNSTFGIINFYMLKRNCNITLFRSLMLCEIGSILQNILTFKLNVRNILQNIVSTT